MSRLRIISGEFGGRLIEAPAGHSMRPMGDRVRSALFNMIDVQGLRVLDAYAGSGAVGLEALSRGAAKVDFVEKTPKVQKVIEQNIASLDVKDRAKLYKMTVSKFIETFKCTGSDPVQTRGGSPKTHRVGPGGLGYDVVFVDPPYHLLPKEFSTALKLKDVVKTNGLMILSYSGRLHVPTVNGVVVVDNRRYGEATLAVFHITR